MTGQRRGGLLGELWAYLAGLLLPVGGLLLALILALGSGVGDPPPVAGWQGRAMTEAAPSSPLAVASLAAPAAPAVKAVGTAAESRTQQADAPAQVQAQARSSAVEVAGIQIRPLLGDAEQPDTPLMMLGAGLITMVLGVAIRQRGQPPAHARYISATH